MQEQFSYKEFEKIPDTYCLPEEFSDFYVHYNELKAEAPYKNIWICKPAASSQGKGIYITDDIHDIDQDESCIVSRYIHNPLLINSHKFDLRLYVLVTSFEPLKIYIYKEGLTRFASEPYSSGHKFNAYSHLTNYSINKKNANFIQNKVISAI
jgi:tubulin polyglutamylase TTLL5